jgi:hypothetical protein
MQKKDHLTAILFSVVCTSSCVTESTTAAAKVSAKQNQVSAERTLEPAKYEPRIQPAWQAKLVKSLESSPSDTKAWAFFHESGYATEQYIVVAEPNSQAKLYYVAPGTLANENWQVETLAEKTFSTFVSAMPSDPMPDKLGFATESLEYVALKVHGLNDVRLVTRTMVVPPASARFKALQISFQNLKGKNH